MLRVLVYLVIVFLVAAGAAWLADRPGEVVLHWQGYEIRTSLLLAAAGVLAVMAVIGIVWALLRAIFRAPRLFNSYLGRRRRDRGYRALTQGIIAVGAGDARAARKAAEESRTLLGQEPLVLLLSAQAAQLAGDNAAARSSFEALAARPETKLLGLHGLFVEAQRQDEHEAARHFAEEAAKAAPGVGWAGPALFEYAARDGDWQAALATLDANHRAGLVDKAAAQKMRAALLTARALEQEAGQPDEARAAALEAHRLEPGLAPAAVLAARLLSRAGDLRRASKVLEAAWKVEPHPEIADAYAMVRPGDSVLDRLKRMRRLAEIRANHPEGSMAVARAAIDARDYAAARAALEGLAKAPSERVCLLMAEIEEREHGDEGRVRAWLTRALSAPRDPAWVADDQVFERWAPVSPVSGRVGVFEWKVPPTPTPTPRVMAAIEADLGADTRRGLVPVTARIESRVAPPEPVAPSEPLPSSMPASSGDPVPTKGPEPNAATASSTLRSTPASPSPVPPVPSTVEAAKAATVSSVEILPPAEASLVAESPSPRDREPAPPASPKAPRPPAANDSDEPAAIEADAPLVPGPPDDPGPLPPDPEEAGERQRRFRFF
ncbi:MAG TPA: heme biosynthesis HemY N-terminal domain-containing protein [Bauldia sp.]|nr:heme biosynthesis HemY N-terminal domain-containing protein [Bauldia sp.]